VVCILLCLLILIQSDKGGGISGAIGGGLAGASSMFGTQDTANVLTRTTAILASIFMGLCIINVDIPFAPFRKAAEIAA